MPTPEVVMFCFAGRKENMELQLPFMRRILEENPNAVYHIWNLARDQEDNEYLRTIEGERITVINDFYGPSPWTQFDRIYRHYSEDRYRGCLFVKLDDDVVFVESARFKEFVEAVADNPKKVISAKTVNNGACTATEPGLQAVFEAQCIPLLDVHKYRGYAIDSHSYFLDHWSEMTNQEPKLIPTEDWLSINWIGYSWRVAQHIASFLGKRSPDEIAGRHFPGGLLGDEGMVNTIPRIILQGFTAAHLYFGPQAATMTDQQLTDLRERYAEVGQKYLLQ